MPLLEHLAIDSILPLTRDELTAVAAAPANARERLAALLDSLNEPQRQVATRRDGPVLVVAGPGAGKTRAVVARVAYLLAARLELPEQILALTFSRRAAGELQERLAALFGSAANDTPRVWAGTFHALGARILRRGGAHHAGRSAGFTIYDQDDTERTLRRILTELGTAPRSISRFGTEARIAISLAKRQGAPPSGALTGDESEVSLGDVAAAYEEALREADAFDFDDLVGRAVRALDGDAGMREAWQRRSRHVLVDEYQDTDPMQEALLRRLSTPPHDICVVADPQQSIYAFRGAAPEQVQRFVRRWQGASIIRLEQNYRSTKSIVAVARRLVAPYLRTPGAAAFGLRLWTENPPGSPARLWVAPHPEKEADAIARDIQAKLETGWIAEEIAVLVRTHAQARPIEAALLRHGVPYVLVGGVRFFGREEIKDALAYLRLALSPLDAASFWRVVNTPRRGLGPAALLTIVRHALRAGGSLAGAREWAATEGGPDGLYDLLAHIDELSFLLKSGAGPRAVLERALNVTGYRDYVRRQHKEDAAGRLEALDELLAIAGAHEDTRAFLDEAALSGEGDEAIPVGGRVRLSTVHAAKGLEFRGVYVPGCELGLFPLAKRRTVAAAADADTEEAQQDDTPPIDGALAIDPEERRVFYVAVTRAKEALTLSYCTFRREGRTEPSPYLAEIGRGLLQRAKLGTDEQRAPKPAARRGKATPNQRQS